MKEERSIVQCARMCKTLGHKLELFNAFHESESKIKQMEEAAVDVHMELILFYTEMVKFYRASTRFGMRNID